MIFRWDPEDIKRNILKNIGNKGLFKNLLVYFISSISAIVISVVLQFLLPKIISIEEYGFYHKTFTLYLSFTSLLHFGLKDGIYLKISEQKNLNLGENRIYFSTILFQQTLVLLIMSTLGFFTSGDDADILFCPSRCFLFLYHEHLL